MNHDRILILDFGSQVTQLIARRVREAHVYCEVHPNDVSEDFIREFAPKGIILSGSYMSAYEESNDQASPAVVQRPVFRFSAFATACRRWRLSSAARLSTVHEA